MDIIDQLPFLPVLIPLLASPLCVLFNRSWVGEVLLVSATAINFFLAVALLWQVSQFGVQSYALGGWSAPWGIEIRVDLFSACVLMLLAFMAAVMAVYAIRSTQHEIAECRRALFYSLFLLLYTGLIGITVTGDVFNLFVFFGNFIPIILCVD